MGSKNTTMTSVGTMLPQGPIFEGLPGISLLSVDLDLNDDDSGHGEGADREHDDSEVIPYNTHMYVEVKDKRLEGRMPLAFAQSTPPPVKQKQPLQVIWSKCKFLDCLRSSPTATLIFGESSVEFSR